MQELHQRFSKSLGLNQHDALINTGFEASMLCFDDDTHQVHFAGAGHHLMIKNPDDGVVQFIKGDKHPIGYRTTESSSVNLHIHSFELKNQLFILYSDGWTTQVGQHARRMMGNTTLLKAIESSGMNSPQELGQILDNFFKDWAGTQERRDDLSMLILQGIKSA
jgi:serine phosphatase RsbU (regulator of sigma subunit)